MLTRFNPFGDLRNLQREMNRFFEPGTSLHATNESFGAWGPPVDIREDPEKLSMKLDLPGMKQDDIKVHVENNVLTVSGERRFEDEEKRDNYHRVERHYGTFSRSFSLPNNVNVGGIQANYTQGVLTLNLPKREEAKPKQIQVKVQD